MILSIKIGAVLPLSINLTKFVLTKRGLCMSLFNAVKSAYLYTANVRANIHLCRVFNNSINEIPARGDNAG